MGLAPTGKRRLVTAHPQGDVCLRPRINRTWRISGHLIEGLLQFPVEWRRYEQLPDREIVYSQSMYLDSPTESHFRFKDGSQEEAPGWGPGASRFTGEIDRRGTFS